MTESSDLQDYDIPPFEWFVGPHLGSGRIRLADLVKRPRGFESGSQDCESTPHHDSDAYQSYQLPHLGTLVGLDNSLTFLIIH